MDEVSQLMLIHCVGDEGTHHFKGDLLVAGVCQLTKARVRDRGPRLRDKKSSIAGEAGQKNVIEGEISSFASGTDVAQGVGSVCVGGDLSVFKHMLLPPYAEISIVAIFSQAGFLSL